MTLAQDANLILMGLRGSGKSTLGRAVAAKLGLPFTFIDLDDLTLRSLGCSTASEAFRTAGESTFRAAEAAALAGVLNGRNRVIALGGGTPTAPGAADLLREARASERAWIVYLHAPPDVLRSRIAGADQSNRPALLARDAASEVGQVYAARDPLYRALASATVESASLSEAAAAEAIARSMREA